jgi:SAM-dependent methyltransferase
VAAFRAMMMSQKRIDTRLNRYPWIFNQVQGQYPSPSRILSYGCSTGMELVSLRGDFPDAELVGTDVNSEALQQARLTASKLNPAATIVEGSNTLADESFDVVVCMSVLCLYPGILSFQVFVRVLEDLVRLLRPGGLLCIYNSQYIVRHSALTPLIAACLHVSTFQHNFIVYDDWGIPTQSRSAILFRKKVRYPLSDFPAPGFPAALSKAMHAGNFTRTLVCFVWDALIISQLHPLVLDSHTIDLYEPDEAIVQIASQWTVYGPLRDSWVSHDMTTFRPPYRDVLILATRFKTDSDFRKNIEPVARQLSQWDCLETMNVHIVGGPVNASLDLVQGATFIPAALPLELSGATWCTYSLRID